MNYAANYAIDYGKHTVTVSLTQNGLLDAVVLGNVFMSVPSLSLAPQDFVHIGDGDSHAADPQRVSL